MKTELNATVTTYQGSFNFSGTEASAVASAVKAHQDILAKGKTQGETETYPLQIPYTSVVKVEYRAQQVESSTEDDNCKVQTPEPKAASLLIQNGGGSSVQITLTLGDTSINGKYGDFTFTNGVAQATIPSNGQLKLTGIADGTSYTISGENIQAISGSLTGTTPATVAIRTASV